MSPAITRTSAFTFARLELIKMQVRIALRRASSIPDSALQSINRGLDNKWIYLVNIYGFDSQNYCRAQLKIEIDWNEHNIQLSSGRAMVSIDGWQDNTAIEIDEALNVFNKYIQMNNLRAEWAVVYPPNLDVNHINRELGFVTMAPIQWASNKGVTSFTKIPELSEMIVGLKILG